MASRDLAPTEQIADTQQVRAAGLALGSLPQALLAVAVALGLGGAAIVLASSQNRFAPLVLAALLAPFVAAVVGRVRYLLLIAAIVSIPIGPDIYFSYQEEIGELGGIGGWNVSLGTMALAGLYALWIAAALTGVARVPRLALRPAIPLFVYLLFNVLSVLVSRDITASMFELFWLAQLILLFLYISSTVEKRKDVLVILGAIMVALALESLIIIGVAATGATFEVAGISTRVTTVSIQAGGFSRAAGTLGSPNAAGAYLAFLLAPALALTFSHLPSRLRLLGGVAFGLGAIALTLTLSRGGLMAFGIAILVLGVVGLHRRWFKGSTIVAMLAIAAVIAIVAGPTLAARLLGDDNGAAFARIPLMQIAFLVIRDYPLGVGLNNFTSVLPHYVGPEFATQFIYSIHNYYLTIWAEIGPLGLIAFLWFLAATIRRAWRCANTLGPDLAPVAVAVLGGLLGETVHMFVDVFKSWAQLDSLLLMAGLLVALSRFTPRESNAPGTRGPMVVPAFIPRHAYSGEG